MRGIAKRRFEEHAGNAGQTITLGRAHPAVVNGTTRFPNMAKPAAQHDRLLRSGQHSRKIGSYVAKGAWHGMPILTLTLEERATCPRSCEHWRSCYGGNMQWAPRIQPDDTLIPRLADEIWMLAIKHPRGFVVRLHVLGDFFSTDYTAAWAGFLRDNAALHVFGYTARAHDSDNGAQISFMNRRWPDRCVIRFSGQPKARPAAVTVTRDDEAGAAIVCPAQTGRTACCGTCALCWSTDRTIAFLRH
jgi:hypothetical protein